MALRENVDVVFVPHVDLVMEKACLICTPSHIYMVMDRKEVDMGFWHDVLSRSTTYESVTFQNKTPRQILAEVIADPNTTSESLQEFLTSLKDRWDAITVYDLAKAKKLKVSKGWWFFGGSITIKQEGNFGYTPVATMIPKPYNVAVHAFYEATATRINAT